MIDAEIAEKWRAEILRGMLGARVDVSVPAVAMAALACAAVEAASQGRTLDAVRLAAVAACGLAGVAVFAAHNRSLAAPAPAAPPPAEHGPPSRAVSVPAPAELWCPARRETERA